MRPQWLRCAAAFLRAGKFKFGRVIPKEKARKHHGFGLFLYIYFFKCGCRLIFRSISISAHEMLMDAPLHFSSGILLCRHFAADLSGENHIPAVSAMPKHANIIFLRGTFAGLPRKHLRFFGQKQNPAAAELAYCHI